MTTPITSAYAEPLQARKLDLDRRLRLAIKYDDYNDQRILMNKLLDEGHMTFDELDRFVKLCTKQAETEKEDK